MRRYTLLGGRVKKTINTCQCCGTTKETITVKDCSGKAYSICTSCLEALFLPEQ